MYMVVHMSTLLSEMLPLIIADFIKSTGEKQAKGAKASDILYSLVETAKANKFSMYKYIW